MQREGLRPGILSALEGADARLLGGRCPGCAQHHFPAQPTCPYCGHDSCVVVPLSRYGTLDLCTTVINRPPGYTGPLPYGFGVVTLAEGLQIISRIEDPEGCPPGTPLELTLGNVGDEHEVVTYSFRRTNDAAAPSPGSGRRPPQSALTTPSPALTGRPVYIAGVGIHPFGRFADKTVTDLGIAAVRMALSEAGIARGGFEAAYCGTVYSGVAAGHKVLTAMGLTGMPIVNVEAGCASGAAALRLAAAAVSSGQHDTVLVFGIEKMPKGMIRSSFFEAWREQGGLAVTPAYFALRAQRLMRDSGISIEQLARVSMKNRRHGVHNPNAMYRKEVSLESVLGSPLVCDPLRLFMLCSPNEGAAAVVVSAKPSAVRLRAVALRSHLPGNVLGEQTPLSGLAGVDVASPTRLAAVDAYEAAGVGPADLDVVELQDTDCARELLSYEELALCPTGASGQWLDEGRTTMSGSLPVNPSGGLLSKGEPLGASALAQIVELYWQLCGHAGQRQVANAKVALAHTVGRGANAAVAILSR